MIDCFFKSQDIIKCVATCYHDRKVFDKDLYRIVDIQLYYAGEDNYRSRALIEIFIEELNGTPKEGVFNIKYFRPATSEEVSEYHNMLAKRLAIMMGEDIQGEESVIFI